MNTIERLAQFVVGDSVVVDVEPVEQRLIEQAALLVVATAVQLLRVGQEFEARFEEAKAVGDFVADDRETFAQMAALQLNRT